MDSVIEPVPGIAAARNRAIELFLATDHSCLVFIDDDEEAREGWLESHIRTAEAHRADCTFGPVLPRYDESVPTWIINGQFFERVRSNTGGHVRFPATNNVMIRRRFFEANFATTFDERFSATGGSDTDFFERARIAGAKLVWCDEAAVDEAVPSARANARWLWRRGVRLGNVSARMLLRRRSRLTVAILGACRVAAAPVAVLAALVTRKGIRDPVMHLPKGVGMIGATLGRNVLEYARPRSASN